MTADEVPMQRAADGADVPVPEPAPEPTRTIRLNGETVGTWGEMEPTAPGDPDWWGSAAGDVQTFHSEADALAWVNETLGL